MLNYTLFANKTNPDIFCFEGTANELKKLLDQMSTLQYADYRSIRINIKGTKVR